MAEGVYGFSINKGEMLKVVTSTSVLIPRLYSLLKPSVSGL